MELLRCFGFEVIENRMTNFEQLESQTFFATLKKQIKKNKIKKIQTFQPIDLFFSLSLISFCQDEKIELELIPAPNFWSLFEGSLSKIKFSSIWCHQDLHSNRFRFTFCQEERFLFVKIRNLRELYESHPGKLSETSILPLSHQAARFNLFKWFDALIGKNEDELENIFIKLDFSLKFGLITVLSFFDEFRSRLSNLTSQEADSIFLSILKFFETRDKNFLNYQKKMIYQIKWNHSKYKLNQHLFQDKIKIPLIDQKFKSFQNGNIESLSTSFNNHFLALFQKCEIHPLDISHFFLTWNINMTEWDILPKVFQKKTNLSKTNEHEMMDFFEIQSNEELLSFKEKFQEICSFQKTT
jgi:hypothetical protein